MIANAPAPKMIEPAAPKFTGVQKAAVLMVTLGDQLSAEVLKYLEEHEVESIGQEIARLNAITPEDAALVLEEFYQLSVAKEYVIKGGLDYAKKMLQNAFGPDTSRKLMDRLVKQMSEEAASFDAIQKADPQQLAKFIHSEHPQTIALILSHLNSSQAAGLLFSLPTEIRADVALRMASLEQISPEIITRIASIIGQKLKSLGELSRESYGGVRAVAEMFNRMDSGTSKEILDVIETNDPNLAETVRHLMFVFDDLLLIDPNAIKEILARVDRKGLTVALKGTSDQLKNHFLQCMSTRGAEMLMEDIDSLGPVKIKEVEAAQQQIITTVRQLEAEGVMSLKNTVGEQYVV
jgi:flagellar motor switch protein FliG